MTFDDFQKNFTKIEMCMLSPDSAGSLEKKKWETKMFQGTWQKYLTAGGCRNFPDTFYLNPQFRCVLTIMKCFYGSILLCCRPNFNWVNITTIT